MKFGLMTHGVGYAGEAGLASVTFAGVAFAGVAYTGESRLTGRESRLQYTGEFLREQNFCGLPCVGHTG